MQQHQLSSEVPFGARQDVVRRTSAEIEHTMNACADRVGARTFDPADRGHLVYAVGFSDGIAWLLGQSEDKPEGT